MIYLKVKMTNCLHLPKRGTFDNTFSKKVNNLQGKIVTIVIISKIDQNIKSLLEL